MNTKLDTDYINNYKKYRLMKNQQIIIENCLILKIMQLYKILIL